MGVRVRENAKRLRFGRVLGGALCAIRLTNNNLIDRSTVLSFWNEEKHDGEGFGGCRENPQETTAFSGFRKASGFEPSSLSSASDYSALSRTRTIPRAVKG
jgi:hypothetical protein